ncbi:MULTISPECIES: AraC family transcriptional regulator [unclassified Roseateles]|uniref:helix-turn-helix domain-containing protein n=1 Tax=unclassified Roseateles TaxID=2626991 RepID=UPI0006F903BE|nr:MULTISPECIES: helix-turn-helix transcriptional regulator [unclassified Roseateles]KQW51895.1 hypothetical protein ASC81_04615 [Pelomonas sp. Root405]KRA78128.1 hypothetical protein ASD88_04620 [Pelomonas sp. Root662]
MPDPQSQTRLGLLGDCFIYTAPAIHSHVCRHSVTIACALTQEPLTVSVGAKQWRGRLLAVRPFVARRMDSGARPAALVDLEPSHTRYSTFSRGALAEPVLVLDEHRFAGLLSCAQAFAMRALTGRQLHAAMQLQISSLADGVARYLPPDARALQMMASLRIDPGQSLAALGRQVGMSATLASRRFVEALGISVRQFSLAVKIQRAAALYGSGRSLTEVAQIAGFSDSSHLAKVWRRCYGGSPSRYFAEHSSVQEGRIDHAWRQQVSWRELAERSGPPLGGSGAHGLDRPTQP